MVCSSTPHGDRGLGWLFWQMFLRRLLRGSLTRASIAMLLPLAAAWLTLCSLIRGDLWTFGVIGLIYVSL